MNPEIRAKLTQALIAYRQDERHSAGHVIAIALEVGHKMGVEEGKIIGRTEARTEALSNLRAELRAITTGAELRAGTQPNDSDSYPVDKERSADIGGILPIASALGGAAIRPVVANSEAAD